MRRTAPPGGVVGHSTDECATAEEFLAKLAPAYAHWQPDPSAWIFRGHGDAEWNLLASAHRPHAFDDYHLPEALRTKSPEWLRLAESEAYLVSCFHKALDEAGLSIPALPPEPWFAAAKHVYPGEVPPDAWATRALAQHHGVPTGFLDWTRGARVAAYFAAADVVAKGLSSRRLCVWALRRDFLAAHDAFGTTSARLELFHAPHATNPNLHAQAGLFTVLRGSDDRVPVDQYVTDLATQRGERLAKSQWADAALMRCLTVPASAAPELLRRLAYEGVSGATMFPGPDGVVRALREQARWDRPPAESAR